MITKRTRILSLLSTVVMLVGMLSCFTLPASAEAAYTTRNLVSALYNAVDWTNKKTLMNEVKAAYGLETDEGNEQALALLDSGFANKEDPLGWKEFDPTDSNKTYPRYIYHDGFTARGYDLNQWSISSSADWEAMRDVANAATEDYFKDVTFHLTKDIKFTMTAIDPMGIDGKAGFAGTIDGHGFGFGNIYVYVKDKSGKGSAGLFARLADCTFKDFGINSGLIHQGSGNGKSCTSSFGCVMPEKEVTFERVWSSAIIAPVCNAQGSGLVGTIEHTTPNVNLNGFVFDGTIVKGQSNSHGGQFGYGIYGSTNSVADGNDFYNVITDFGALGGAVKLSSGVVKVVEGNRYVRAALFAFSSTDAFYASDMENVYAVKRASNGIDEGYFDGAATFIGGAASKSLLTDMSAAEVAYHINNNPSQNADRVYFTMDASGKIRPSAKGTNRVVKVTMTGDRNEVFYIGREVKYDQSVLGITAQQTIDVKEGTFKISDGLIKVSGDVVLEVTVDCTHDYSCVSTGTGNTHTKTCAAGCTAAVEESCAANSYTANAITVDQLIAGEKATHSGICKDCGVAFTQECTFEYEVKKGESNVWNFDCACGREDLVHTGVSLMVAGNANGNATIDLIDAVAVLKNLVSGAAINKLNADMDGNTVIDVTDAYRIILLWMGDTKVLLESEDLEARVNTLNHYDPQAVTNKNLKMDGTWGTNERYYVTDPIEVGVGNKITFGPVRYAQPVMGFFYDAQGNPVQLINQTNIETTYTFEEGMIMASVVVPKGAASARLQANTKEKDQFYIRINNEFSLMDYTLRTGSDGSELANPEKNQYMLTVGDSLCAAARDDTPYAGKKGWAARIYRDFGADVINASQGGSALSTVRFIRKLEELQKNEAANDDLLAGDGFTIKQCIVNQLTAYRDSGRQFEYILLEGGGNDASQLGEVGTFHPTSFNPADFDDETTYAGGLERAIYSAIKDHGDTAAIGYMSAYPMPLATKYPGFQQMEKYFKVGEKICEKWGIEYLDLYTLMADFDTEKYTSNGKTGADYKPDYIHANGVGYDMIQEHLGPFVSQMRPASQEIYLEVQKYEDINIGWSVLEDYKHLFGG